MTLGGEVSAQQNIGAAQRVVHLVTGALAPSEQPVVLRAGIDVFANESVKTAEASAALLVFQDKTELSIGSNSEIVLDRFVFDPDPAKSAIAVSLLSGVARFSTGVLPKSAYTIRTPAATLSVRGTTFTITVTKQPEQPEKRRRNETCADPFRRKTEVNVISGIVAVSARGETVLVNAGRSSTVDCGERPSPAFDSLPQSQALNEMDTLLQQAALQLVPTPGFGNTLLHAGGPANPGAITNNAISPSHMQ